MINHTTSRSPRQIAYDRARKDIEITSPERASELERQVAADADLGYSDISGRIGKIPDCHPDFAEGIVSVFENDIEVKRYARKRGGGVKKEIKEFSDKSRRHLLKKLNRLRWPPGGCLFITLTFPDDFPDVPKAKALFRALFKRMKRAYPGFENLWRQELKRRKSGVNIGKIAPHYHFFAFGIEGEIAEFDKWLRANWTELAGAADAEKHIVHGTDVKPVDNRKQAAWYISKYMSKSENDAECKAGRAWGYSSGLDFSPLQVIRMGQAELAVLRALVEHSLLMKGSPYWLNFWDLPEWMGWHVYGFELHEVRAMLDTAMRHTIGLSTIEIMLRATGGVEVEHV